MFGTIGAIVYLPMQSTGMQAGQQPETHLVDHPYTEDYFLKNLGTVLREQPQYTFATAPTTVGLAIVGVLPARNTAQSSNRANVPVQFAR